MPAVLSAVDCIGPAFAQTKRQLFAPFRWQRWGRLAIVGMLTGEFTSGGGSPGAFHHQAPHTRRLSYALNLQSFDWNIFRAFLPLIIAAITLLVILVVLWIYVASVYRFVLFDSVLHDRCELKGSWGRWEPLGRTYFYWCLSLFVAVGAGLLVLIGGPVLAAWSAGWFGHPREHLPQLILGGILLLFALLALIFASALAGFFAKDFCVPLMALEDVGILDAWGRLLPMLAREKLAYAGFVLMKSVLAVGSAILVGIATLVTLVIVAIPLGITGLALYLLAKAAGVLWNPATLSIAVVLGVVIVSGLLYLIALINTPPMVFFQAYVLHFFAGRYPPLGAIMFPPTPEPPPATAPAG